MSEQEAELWSSWVRNQEAVPDEGANQTEDTRLHQEESRKAALFDNLLCHLPMGVFWKDRRRRFLGANPYFLDYYGFSSVADILGKTDEDMGWHPDNEKYRSNEEDVIASGIVVSSVPGRCIAKGVSRDIYATKWPTYEDGRISGLMGYFLDPGERGQAAGCVPEHPAKQDPMACSASRFLDDLLDFERDYQLNQRTFGVIYVRIPRRWPGQRGTASMSYGARSATPDRCPVWARISSRLRHPISLSTSWREPRRRSVRTSTPSGRLTGCPAPCTRR